MVERGLQQQRHQGQHSQRAVGYLSRSEHLFGPDLAPAQQDVALIRLQDEVSEERSDQPHRFDNTMVVSEIDLAHAKQESG